MKTTMPSETPFRSHALRRRSFLLQLAWCLGLTAAISLTGAAKLHAQNESLKVATSIYPGWMDNWLMEMPLEKGQPTFLAKRTKETGGKVEIVKFKEYIPSVEALVAGKVDACTMTLGEALAFPADSGVEIVCLFVHDYSNGNDGVLFPKSWTLDTAKGKPVVAEEFSVSQYLVYRFLQTAGKPRDYFAFKNTPGDDVSKTFLAAVGTKDEVAGATWNPHVLRVMESGKASLAFSSREIPGEIVDMLVMRKDRIKGRENSIKAYVAAHYDVMGYFTASATRERCIRAMASAAEFSAADAPLYSKMLDATRFYTSREDAVKFLTAPQFKETEGKVRNFLKEFGAFKSKDPEALTVPVDTSYLK